MISNVQYILELKFLSPILSVLPLNCFTTVGASHYYTYIYASYVMYKYNLYFSVPHEQLKLISVKHLSLL